MSEVAELVPILRAVDSDVKAEVFKEVSAGWKTAREIEEKFGAPGADALRFFEKMKLVETKWQTGSSASPEKAYHAFYSSFHINATAPVQEISDVLHAAMMSEEAYAVIEHRIFD
ncbi:MAG: ArsR family transcriptional regulator, partial [Thermoplasmata archaeon]